MQEHTGFHEYKDGKRYNSDCPACKDLMTPKDTCPVKGCDFKGPCGNKGKDGGCKLKHNFGCSYMVLPKGDDEGLLSWEGIRIVFQECDKKGITDNMFVMEVLCKKQRDFTRQEARHDIKLVTEGAKLLTDHEVCKAVKAERERLPDREKIAKILCRKELIVYQGVPIDVYLPDNLVIKLTDQILALCGGSND